MIDLQDNLFAMTESLPSEDLTTAVLAYLLGQPSEHAYRTLFCNRVLGYHPPPVVSAVRFQADLGEYGRADLTIDTEAHKIIVENKFYASFSQNDQLLRYSKFLINRVSDREGILVLLTIKDRKAFYLAEIARALGVDYGRGSSGITAAQAVRPHFDSLGVAFRVLTWEDVLYDFSTGSEVVRALREFIHARYVKNTEFTAKEIEMLDSDQIPSVMEKVWGTVDKAKDALLASGTQTGRTTQSRLLYGFSINQGWGDAWLINNIPVWRTVQSAFVLQVREEWISDSESANAVLASLNRLGFQIVPSWEYVYPLRVSDSSDSDLVNAVVSQAQEVLARIRTDLEG